MTDTLLTGRVLAKARRRLPGSDQRRLSMAMLGLASMFGPFWALATSTMGVVGATASIALVNPVGNTGGFVGPYLLGAINDATHSFALGLLAIAAMLAAGAALVLFVHDDV